MEPIAIAIEGMYRDVLKRDDERIVFDSGWKPNTIVDAGRTLLAAIMKNDQSRGIQYLAVGQGVEEWDNKPEPVPANLRALIAMAPRDPDQVPDIAYLDTTGNTAGTPTTRLQVTVTLPPGYPPPLPGTSYYPLREFGLFGGDDYLINCVRHAVIHKDAAATLVRMIRLSF